MKSAILIPCALAACADEPACAPSSDTCTGEDICIAAQCEPAFGRTYAITSITVRVPDRDPHTSATWDPADPPDLYLGDAQGRPLTATVSNALGATFPGPIPVTLAAGDPLRIDLWDDDAPGAPQFVFGCRAEIIGAAQLRARGFGCASSDTTFYIGATIRPRGEP